MKSVINVTSHHYVEQQQEANELGYDPVEYILETLSASSDINWQWQGME